MVVQFFLTMLLGIPMLLLLPAYGFLALGMKYYFNRPETVGMASIRAKLYQHLTHPRNPSPSWWETLGFTADYAHQPSLLAKLFFFPGVFLLEALEGYERLLLWPVQKVAARAHV
jgi:hypothetical protein